MKLTTWEWVVVVVIVVVALLGGYGFLRREVPAVKARSHGGILEDCRVLNVDEQRYWSCVVSDRMIITVPCTKCDQQPRWEKP